MKIHNETFLVSLITIVLCISNGIQHTDFHWVMIIICTQQLSLSVLCAKDNNDDSLLFTSTKNYIGPGLKVKMTIDDWVKRSTMLRVNAHRLNIWYTPQKIVMLWSTTFAQLSPIRATLQFWQILGCFGADNLPFWGNLGANWNLEHP